MTQETNKQRIRMMICFQVSIIDEIPVVVETESTGNNNGYTAETRVLTSTWRLYILALCQRG